MFRAVLLGVGCLASVSLLVTANSAAAARNRPPVVTTSLPPRTTAALWDVVRFTVTVTDPDGDRVFARLVEAPTTLTFQPIVDEPSGATRRVIWPQDYAATGRRELVVEAWDDRAPSVKVRARFPLQVMGIGWSAPVRALDLDDDAALEVVARASEGDLAGADDAGALALFDPPFTTSGARPLQPLLAAAPPVADAQLGANGVQGLQFADVTGDGRDDVIAVAASHGGTLLVWAPPLALHGAIAPSAVLLGSDPVHGMAIGPLGPYGGEGVLVADVTNDGVLDLVAAYPMSDVAAPMAGEVCVFAGGKRLAGGAGVRPPIAPTARLTIPGAQAGDLLAHGPPAFGQLLWIDDVSGDGVPDVIVAAPHAADGTKPLVGQLFVWEGGARLVGAPAPLAQLHVSTAAPGDTLGYVEATNAVRLVDVTGDGILDVIAGAQKAKPGGALYVWPGGAALKGVLDPAATLRVPGMPRTEQLGFTFGSGDGIQFADVTADGIADVVVATSRRTVGGAANAGAIDVWAGGPLAGTLAPTAELVLATPRAGDQLCAATLYGLQLLDVSGDGVADVVATGSRVTSTTGTAGAGGIFVWLGGAGMTGTKTPHATLEIAGAVAGDALGSAGVLLGDVTGDAVADVVAAAPLADVNGTVDCGALQVWHGGATIAAGGVLAPSATLLDPNANAYDLLAYLGPTSFPLVDFDGDGVLDVVALTGWNAVKTKRPIRIAIWRGGAQLTGPLAPTAMATAQQAADGLGNFGRELLFRDVTGDGRLDLLAGAPYFNLPGIRYPGAVYVFAGGPLTSSTLLPHAILVDPDGDRRAEAGESGLNAFVVADFDGDGGDDLLVAVPDAGDNFSQIGELQWFQGPLAPRTPAAARPAILSVGPLLGDGAHLGE